MTSFHPGVARRVVEAVRLGKDVLVAGSPDREGRAAFLAELGACGYGDLAFAPAPPVALKDLNWKAKHVESMIHRSAQKTG